MIDDAYARLLLGKVTDAVIERLGTLDNDELALTDLERVRRLVADGQVAKARLHRALELVEKNESLGEDLRTRAGEELRAEQPERGATLPNELELPKPGAHRSTDVLLPGDFPTDELPSRGWVPVVGDELQQFVGQISPVDGVLRLTAETTHCHWRTLPWYEKVALIRLHDPTWSEPRLALYFLTLEGNLFRLNGTSPPLHEVNAKAPLRLNAENVLDYLRFFCFFVQGEEGPFYVVESADDPWIPQMARTPAVVKGLEAVTAAELKDADDQGRFRCSAVIYYSNAIFKAEMQVAPSGMIEMLSDDPI